MKEENDSGIIEKLNSTPNIINLSG